MNQDQESDIFQKFANVSRETTQKLALYAEELSKWQKSINLIGKNTLPEIWKRHFLDSAQLRQFLHKDRGRIVDVGSGAGFPGLVLSILGEDRIDLVERDKRKCAFLRAVVHRTGATARVINIDISEYAPTPALTITARAVAEVGNFLDLVTHLLTPRSHILLLKGSHVQDELILAQKKRKLTTRIHPSQAGPDGCVLEIENIQHAPKP
ncbi:MAG: 16S rRNA (guanine(527)-N(7))-methyltransferase RsmG [Alphaproteobacteria bacterium]